MQGVGIDRGRRRLRVSAWGFALLLVACGGTTQQSGGDNHPAGGNAGAGGANGSAGVATGGGGAQAMGCPTSSQPTANGACQQEGQVCSYPGNPCGPPGYRYTCTAGTWQLTYEGEAAGICLPEACPGLNPTTGCPYSAPMPGMSCGGVCLMKTQCQYPDARAECIAGTWRLMWPTGGAAGTGGMASGAAGAPDEAAGGWGGVP